MENIFHLLKKKRNKSNEDTNVPHRVLIYSVTDGSIFNGAAPVTAAAPEQ